MAFRIHHQVERGEIDNRVKGLVRGKIWVTGRDTPVVLELKGNAWPDLAGCLLTFTNPRPSDARPDLDSLHPLQTGSVGDLTASRKVRVFDVPLAEALAMAENNQKPPEHLANCLYLEWYSERNGRVVIESADYVLTISTPEWRLTAAEEPERARQAAAGMDEFMQQVVAAISAEETDPPDEDLAEEPWDEHDYERFLRECDARTEKYGQLLEKYGDSDEAQEQIAEEMGWNRDEDEEMENPLSVQKLNLLCEASTLEPPWEPDPATEGVDWVRTPTGDVRHPLQYRCGESSFRFRRQIREQAPSAAGDDEVRQFTEEFQITSAKLAGALNGFAGGDRHLAPAFIVACLKRALGHLHAAQAGLEAVAARNGLPAHLIAEARAELFAIREGMLALMDRFRGR